MEQFLGLQIENTQESQMVALQHLNEA